MAMMGYLHLIQFDISGLDTGQPVQESQLLRSFSCTGFLLHSAAAREAYGTICYRLGEK